MRYFILIYINNYFISLFYAQHEICEKFNLDAIVKDDYSFIDVK